MKKLIIVWLGCGLICLLGCEKAAPKPHGWLTSVPEAEALAKTENKLVLLNFTGSDWCAACKVLDNTVFSNQTFVDFANKNLVMVYLDYPFGTNLPAPLEKANNELKKKYDIQGYPTLIALKPDGQSVWTNLGLPEGGATSVVAQLELALKK